MEKEWELKKDMENALLLHGSDDDMTTMRVAERAWREDSRERVPSEESSELSEAFLLLNSTNHFMLLPGTCK